MDLDLKPEPTLHTQDELREVIKITTKVFARLAEKHRVALDLIERRTAELRTREPSPFIVDSEGWVFEMWLFQIYRLHIPIEQTADTLIDCLLNLEECPLDIEVERSCFLPPKGHQPAQPPQPGEAVPF